MWLRSKLESSVLSTALLAIYKTVLCKFRKQQITVILARLDYKFINSKKKTTMANTSNKTLDTYRNPSKIKRLHLIMNRLFFITFLLIPIFIFSQTEDEKLKSDVINSFEAINSSDYETVLNYLPDFVFENISKKEILKNMSAGGANQNIQNAVNIKIDTIITLDSVKYARFYIDSTVPTYGIKAQHNSNWTFIDLNEVTLQYIPSQIRVFKKNN